MTENLPRKALTKGLGRGLSALLGEDFENQLAPDQVWPAQTVPVEKLVPNRFQPRRWFDPEELKALVESIRVNGILMPIIVRRVGDGPSYEIVAGERRWRAAQEAQIYEVPVVVRELDDEQALELALVENIQRQDLTPLEEAEGYQRLMKDFGHTQENVAQVSGKSRSHIANTLRLLGLPVIIKDMLQDGSLSVGHARAILSAEQPEYLAEQVIAKGLNVRQTEQLVKKWHISGRISNANQNVSLDPNTQNVAHEISEQLGLVVKVKQSGEQGEVRIAFKSLEQFDLIKRCLMRHGEVF